MCCSLYFQGLICIFECFSDVVLLHLQVCTYSIWTIACVPSWKGKEKRKHEFATEFHYMQWLKADYDDYKCMEATAVRNINSRETTGWLFLGACWVVHVGVSPCGWLHSENIYFCLSLYSFGCVRLHICKPIYIYVFQHPCICCYISIYVFFCGWVDGNFRCMHALLGGCFILHMN